MSSIDIHTSALTKHYGSSRQLVSEPLSAATGCKARGSAFSVKSVLNVLQHASEPFLPRALTTSFSLDLTAKQVWKPVMGIANLNMTVQRGEIFGFCGPNGSGKTTTLRLLLGLIKPSQGEITLLGKKQDMSSRSILSDIGYLPGDIGLYEDLTGSQYLKYLMKLRKRRNRNSIRQRMEYLIDRFSIDVHRVIASYSKGMKQIIGIIQAFMHEPQLLILDEPSAGLDPIMQERLYELLQEMRQEGKTILFSSHVLSEVGRMCDRVGFVKQGELICVKDVKQVAKSTGHNITVRLSTPLQRIPDEIGLLDGVRGAKIQEYVLAFNYTGEIKRLIQCLAGMSVEDVVCEKPDIEEVFYSYYED
jgi:ABC-2 type transport system ATP-binding protein